MPPAARVLDNSTHGGVIVGPGVPTVLIGKKPAAVAYDLHACPIPAAVPAHGPVATPFLAGSATVMIGGKPALRTSDSCLCGAMAAVGEPTVMIGG